MVEIVSRIFKFQVLIPKLEIWNFITLFDLFKFQKHLLIFFSYWKEVFCVHSVCILYKLSFTACSSTLSPYRSRKSFLHVGHSPLILIHSLRQLKWKRWVLPHSSWRMVSSCSISSWQMVQTLIGLFRTWLLISIFYVNGYFVIKSCCIFFFIFKTVILKVYIVK